MTEKPDPTKVAIIDDHAVILDYDLTPQKISEANPNDMIRRAASLLGQKGGRVMTYKKLKAVRKNGRLGGRPAIARAAWRTIGSRKYYFKSKMEANYARYLQWQKSRGLIASWDYEPVVYYFEDIKSGTRSYKPDFVVTLSEPSPEGRLSEVHEVKGWMDPTSKVKLRRMAKYYPNIFVRLIDEKWFRANAALKIVIKDWE